jgi:hypothetical protein
MNVEFQRTNFATPLRQNCNMKSNDKQKVAFQGRLIRKQSIDEMVEMFESQGKSGKLSGYLEKLKDFIAGENTTVGLNFGKTEAENKHYAIAYSPKLNLLKMRGENPKHIFTVEGEQIFEGDVYSMGISPIRNDAYEAVYHTTDTTGKNFNSLYNETQLGHYFDNHG